MRELRLDAKTDSFMIDDKSYPLSELLKLPNISAEFAITIEEVEAFLLSDMKGKLTKNIEDFFDKIASEQISLLRESAENDEELQDLEQKAQKAEALTKWYQEQYEQLMKKIDDFFEPERAKKFREINEKIDKLQKEVETENNIKLCKAKASALRSYEKQLHAIFKDKKEWEEYQSTIISEIDKLQEEYKRRSTELDN